MKMKSIIAGIMLVVCLFVLLPASVSADNEQVRTVVTGDPNRTPPTKSEIIDAKKNITTYTTTFDVMPSVYAPYATGKLNADFLQNGADYLNYIRYIAHLPNIQLDDALVENAQHGAVVGAVHYTLTGEFTHYPAQPSDMDTAFYSAGYTATTSSNLGLGYYNLPGHIQGCMDDSSGYSNLVTLGHRRWLLSSRLKNVGFGYAERSYPLTVTKVFDRSGPILNYDLVTWPASGNMPSDIFDCDVPWSITVNTSRYTRTSGPVEIRVINNTTGEIWNFDENTPNAPNSRDAYFLLESSGYGDWAVTCIFRPEYYEFFEYTGSYTVELRGWADYSNPDQPLVLTYDVDFFDPQTYMPPSDVPGDVDSNGVVDNRDVEYLLWHTLFPSDYPLINHSDFDSNNVVDNRDVEYLLWHTLFPQDFPL